MGSDGFDFVGKTVRRVAGVSAVCLLLAGCGGPGDRQARGDFEADYPGLRVTDYKAAEGNSSAVWYNFRFVNKVTGKAGEMQVLYNWDADAGKWTHEKIADRILPQ